MLPPMKTASVDKAIKTLENLGSGEKMLLSADYFAAGNGSNRQSGQALSIAIYRKTDLSNGKKDLWRTALEGNRSRRTDYQKLNNQAFISSPRERSTAN